MDGPLIIEDVRFVSANNLMDLQLLSLLKEHQVSANPSAPKQMFLNFILYRLSTCIVQFTVFQVLLIKNVGLNLGLAVHVSNVLNESFINGEFCLYSSYSWHTEEPG